MAKLSKRSALYKSKVVALIKARAVRSRNAKAKIRGQETSDEIRHMVAKSTEGPWQVALAVPDHRGHLLTITCLRCNTDMGKGIGNALTPTKAGLVALCVECAK